MTSHIRTTENPFQTSFVPRDLSDLYRDIYKVPKQPPILDLWCDLSYSGIDDQNLEGLEDGSEYVDN